jgi:hypothetical protein
LIEVASWATYYERTSESIKEICDAGIAERPPQNIIEQPELFHEWLQQCEETARRG